MYGIGIFYDLIICSFWLSNIVKMTPQKFHEEVVLRQPANTFLLKRLAAFLYGRPDWEAALIPLSNFMISHLEDSLKFGPDNFQMILNNVNLQEFTGMQKSGIVLANMKVNSFLFSINQEVL